MDKRLPEENLAKIDIALRELHSCALVMYLSQTKGLPDEQKMRLYNSLNGYDLPLEDGIINVARLLLQVDLWCRWILESISDLQDVE